MICVYSIPEDMEVYRALVQAAYPDQTVVWRNSRDFQPFMADPLDEVVYCPDYAVAIRVAYTSVAPTVTVLPLAKTGDLEMPGTDVLARLPQPPPPVVVEVVEEPPKPESKYAHLFTPDMSPGERIQVVRQAKAQERAATVAQPKRVVEMGTAPAQARATPAQPKRATGPQPATPPRAATAPPAPEPPAPKEE